MKILSEKTNKEYASVEECLAAEKAFEEAKAKAEADRKAKAANRAARAKEVEDAYAKFHELRKEFIKDYGSFHMTFTDKNSLPESVNPLFDFVSNFLM